MARDDAGLRWGAAVPSLVRWGLSADADLVYRALATAGAGTSRWLAKDLGVSMRRVECALDELIAAAAVWRESGTRWTARPAQEVVAALRRRRLRAAEPAGRARFHHAILSGLALPRGPHPHGLRATHLSDRTQTRPRIAELIGAERHEHLALQPERSFDPDTAEVALPLDRELQSRGVRVRTCGVPPVDGDTSCAAAQQLARLTGFEYRERTEVPVKLMIFDRRVALLPADPSNLAAGALEIDQPSVVAALVVLFDQIWSTARDPRKGGVPPIVLTSRERAIVGLLAEGCTDAVVAQRLGISQRTIAYTLRTLMDRLGVENRFQLGLTLGAMHAITPPQVPEPAEPSEPMSDYEEEET